MADTSVFLSGPVGAVKIKAVDQGNGTYALKVTTTDGSGTTVYLPGPTGPTAVKVVSQGDGTYALLVTT